MALKSKAFGDFYEPQQRIYPIGSNEAFFALLIPPERKMPWSVVQIVPIFPQSGHSTISAQIHCGDVQQD